MIAVILTLCGIGTASAQFQDGNLILSVAPPTPFQNTTQSWIKVFAPSGVLNTEIKLAWNVIISNLNFHNSSLLGIWSGPFIYSISSDGSLAPAGPLVATRSFVFDRQGQLYIADGTTLKKFDTRNQLTASYSLPQVASQIDLASNQCTLYYISPSNPAFPHLLPATIGRYDVCASHALAALNTSLPTDGITGTLRVLPDNEVLLGTSTGVHRIAQDGTITRTYPGGPTIALDVNGDAFWEAGTGRGTDRARKIDLATGTVIATSDSYGENYILFSMTVVGEPRAAVAPAPAVPTVSHAALILLAITLAVIALTRFTTT